MNANARIALATSGEFASLTPDDRRVIAPLAELGISAEPAVWTDPRADWGRFDAIVLRSTWDYHLAPVIFLHWLAEVAARGVRVFNPPQLVRWNLNKRYLEGLAADGVPIVPTEWVGANDPRTLAAIARARGWSRVVVKPTISASAFETWTSAAPFCDTDDARFRAANAVHGLMVQPFIEAVKDEGEWSLVFFGGRFSHAVLKRPRAGDYRVQGEFGGAWKRAAPDPASIAAAERVLAARPFPASEALYARVDGVSDGGRFALMELELVEPSLFLDADEGAARRFAGAIASRLADAHGAARAG